MFFAVVAKTPDEVCPADVLGFITAQRTSRVGARAVLQSPAVDREFGGVSSTTVARRLSTISGFFAFLQVRGDAAANPVPRGLPTGRRRRASTAFAVGANRCGRPMRVGSAWARVAA